MARTAVFEDKMKVVEVLKALEAAPAPRGKGPASYFLMAKLVEKGLVDYKKAEVDGRKLKAYHVSGKGRSYLALSKRWAAKTV